MKNHSFDLFAVGSLINHKNLGLCIVDNHHESEGDFGIIIRPPVPPRL